MIHTLCWSILSDVCGLWLLPSTLVSLSFELAQFVVGKSSTRGQYRGENLAACYIFPHPFLILDKQYCLSYASHFVAPQRLSYKTGRTTAFEFRRIKRGGLGTILEEQDGRRWREERRQKGRGQHLIAPSIFFAGFAFGATVLCANC